jgi:glucokinase
MCSGTAIAREALARAEARPRGALARAAQRAGALDAHLVATLAVEGKREAVEVLGAAGRWLGVGLASLANIFNPDVMVVGGGVGEVGESILAPAREEYRRRALPPNAAAPVLRAALGNRAGMLGAALIAREAVQREPPEG